MVIAGTCRPLLLLMAVAWAAPSSIVLVSGMPWRQMASARQCPAADSSRGAVGSESLACPALFAARYRECRCPRTVIYASSSRQLSQAVCLRRCVATTFRCRIIPACDATCQTILAYRRRCGWSAFPKLIGKRAGYGGRTSLYCPQRMHIEKPALERGLSDSRPRRERPWTALATWLLPRSPPARARRLT